MFEKLNGYVEDHKGLMTLMVPLASVIAALFTLMGAQIIWPSDRIIAQDSKIQKVDDRIDSTNAALIQTQNTLYLTIANVDKKANGLLIFRCTETSRRELQKLDLLKLCDDVTGKP